jgi:hypothetical protein
MDIQPQNIYETTCPKCGANITDGVCSNCGLIIKKYISAENRPKPDAVILKTWPKNPFLLILKTIWCLTLAYFLYTGHGISGEGALFYAIVDMTLAFPSSLLIFLFVPLMNTWFPPALGPSTTEEIIFSLFIFIAGYVQWFVFLPCLVRAICKEEKSIREKKKERE